MIELIGKDGCSSCDMVKNIFDNKNISYAYDKLDNLEENKRKDYIAQARAKGMLGMPIVVKDGIVINFREVIA